MAVTYNKREYVILTMASIPDITVERFLEEDLFTLLGLPDISQEDKDEITEKLNDTVLMRVYAKILSQISEEEGLKLESVPSEEIISYIEGLGFNLSEMLVEELLTFRLELVTMYSLTVSPLLKTEAYLQDLIAAGKLAT